jgi:NAD(P)-dependent dehydrogenase (short-subunit alcohol dehydrogenase family)
MCKHVLPVMREQGSGAIVNVSSIAAVCSPDIVAYKTSKAGVNALTHALVLGAAKHGIRVNAVMPGLIDTPMAIEGISAASGIDREELRARRSAQVPLGRRMGTAWDVAQAICFLASDEAVLRWRAEQRGPILPVDGGQSSRIG